jgi:hypothetical protein
MRPRVLTISPYAATDPNAVSLSQTPAAGGRQALNIDGFFVVQGVATMDFRRQVVITSAGDDTGRVFLVKGTDEKGNERVEAVVGANAGVASTVQAFTTVTSIEVDDDTAGAIEVGTLSIISSNWLPLDYLRTDFQVALGIAVGGATADLTVELTLSNILARRGNDPQPQVGSWLGSDFDLLFPTINIHDHDTMVNVTADVTGNLAFPVRAIRLKSNAVLTGDDVSLEVVQSSHGA